MTNLNHTWLNGRLTRDADLKYTSAGYAISNFALAVNESKKKENKWEDSVSFFDINVYGKMAENLKQYLKKGKFISLHGKLRQDRWDQNGETRTRVVIVALDIEQIGPDVAHKSNQRQEEYKRTESTGAYGERTEDSLPEDIPF